MDFSVQFLSFFVLQSDEPGSNAAKTYKHYRTLDEEAYAHSEIRRFLDGEFARICKRKVEKNPNTDQAPTKIGRFVVEPGYELDSNPNYNLFQRMRLADNKTDFLNYCDEMVRIYMNTSSVRGGALIMASAKLNSHFDDPFLFVMKCDFEPKVARISDEDSLIAQVDMAISARNMKSIQFPFMPEEGMLEESELKIHQASHARYFEDFLKYVSYEKSMPEIVSEQVLNLVQQFMVQQVQEDRGEGARLTARSETAAPSGYEPPPIGPDLEQVMVQAAAAAEQYTADSYTESGAEAGSWLGSAAAAQPIAGDEADVPYAPIQRGPNSTGDDHPGPDGSSPQAHGMPAELQHLELWAAREKRELQETWSHEQVLEAAAHLTGQKHDLELKLKLDGVAVKGLLADYGGSVHIARHRGRYVVLIEGDQFEFDKGVNPVQLLKPEPIERVIARLGGEGGASADDGKSPWE